MAKSDETRKDENRDETVREFEDLLHIGSRRLRVRAVEPRPGKGFLDIREYFENIPCWTRRGVHFTAEMLSILIPHLPEIQKLLAEIEAGARSRRRVASSRRGRSRERQHPGDPRRASGG